MRLHKGEMELDAIAQVTSSPIFKFDSSILLWIQDNIRSDFLTPIMKVITHLGDKGILWILVTLALLWYYKTRKLGVRCMVSMVIGLVITNLILKNFAEGYRGDTVRERYAVVPVQGKLVTFRFPQRWLESEQAIVDATQELLNGTAQYIDKYIVVRGTVQTLPEDVSGELYSWFADNQEWMQQAGLISAEQDAAASLADYMVSVDTAGKLPFSAIVALTVAAGLCLLYALYELIRILAGGYAVKQVEAEASAESEEGIEVEITEQDPETGEDVTDLEVEIVEEEETAPDAEA